MSEVPLYVLSGFRFGWPREQDKTAAIGDDTDTQTSTLLKVLNRERFP